eukprot:TRINITY_DN15869_c0_g1_i1.p1 TRINITY_DN15869_c0_g1~~TRINITY_DN15869_c0_g1_i1.p1  ORF type:complete len:274 (-),score=32.01 TRINITY_DN15869_c0_g1_i1:101-922(-)
MYGLHAVLVSLLGLALSAAVEYTGDASGGFNLFTFNGAASSVEGCHEDTSFSGVSEGMDLTFGSCFRADDFGLDGERSRVGDDAYFMVEWDQEANSVRVTVYYSDECDDEGVLWAVEDIQVGDCVCEEQVFGGCFIVTIPTWTASILPGEEECTVEVATWAVVTHKNLQQNMCYDGTEDGIGFYMLWTFPCKGNDAGDYKRQNSHGVGHRLSLQCQAGCKSADCLHAWTIDSDDCLCSLVDGKGCLKASFISSGSSIVASVALLIASLLFVYK